MRKRVLAGILAVVMAGSIMTGCAGTKKTENKSSVYGENKNKPTSEKVELTIWAGKEDRDYIKKVSENFINEHKSEADITIKQPSVPYFGWEFNAAMCLWMAGAVLLGYMLAWGIYVLKSKK